MNYKIHLSVEEAVKWFRDKYPDAMCFKDGKDRYYYDSKESFRIGRNQWRMWVDGEGTIYFSSYELNPDLTIQVRWIVGEVLRQQRIHFMERLEQIAAELNKDLTRRNKTQAAYALRRVREALQIPVVPKPNPLTDMDAFKKSHNNLVKPKKKGKKK
jgi:hypothetical protein